MTVYIVTVNGKISQEAYKTLEEAQDFIYSRTNEPKVTIGEQHGYVVLTDDNNNRYEIHDVRTA